MIFHFENERDSENELNARVDENGELHIAVAEEMAVDSYNQTFDCSILLDADSAIGLRDFLILHFPLA